MKIFVGYTLSLPYSNDPDLERDAWMCAIAPNKDAVTAMLTRHGFGAQSARATTRELQQVTLPITPDHNNVTSPHRSNAAMLLDAGLIPTGAPGVYVWDDCTHGSAVTALLPRRATKPVATFHLTVRPPTESEAS